MRTGREEIAAEARCVHVLVAETVHAVDDEAAPVRAARPLLAFATTSAIGAIGSLTPVEEWTQVTPTARVFGAIARESRATISSARASALLS